MATFKGLVKTCAVCSATFKVSLSLDRVRTCSRECGYQARVVANKKVPERLRCAHCASEFTSVPCHAARRVFCTRGCAMASTTMVEGRRARFAGSANPSWRGGATIRAMSSSGRAYKRSALHIENAKSARRRVAKGRATPPWADLAAIAAIYAEAQRVTEQTGVPHHVDHEVPLNSPIVSGLHVQTNLRVIPASINLSKGNRLIA